MKELFLDASVLLATLDSDDRHQDAAMQLCESDAALSTLDLCYYEACNIAIKMWRDQEAAVNLRSRVDAIDAAGGLTRVDGSLADHAARIAFDHGISVYDAAYVAAARRRAAVLVSCDERDLVSKGLAVLPETAVTP